MIRLPAEWEPQSAVMLTWPHADGDFADSHASVARCFFEIASAIACRQPLLISFSDPAQQSSVSRDLLSVCPAEHLQTYCLPSNDVWTRDHGPIGVIDNGRSRLLKFRFDGWGGS